MQCFSWAPRHCPVFMSSTDCAHHYENLQHYIAYWQSWRKNVRQCFAQHTATYQKVIVVQITANNFTLNFHCSTVMLPVTHQLSKSQFEPNFAAPAAPSRLGLKAVCCFTMLFGVWGSMLLCVAPPAICSSIKALKGYKPTLRCACCRYDAYI